MNEFLSVLPLIIVLIVFYTILWVPQRRRNKRHTKMINDLKIGNNVVTDSGIYGRIVFTDTGGAGTALTLSMTRTRASTPSARARIGP